MRLKAKSTGYVKAALDSSLRSRGLPKWNEIDPTLSVPLPMLLQLLHESSPLGIFFRNWLWVVVPAIIKHLCSHIAPLGEAEAKTPGQNVWHPGSLLLLGAVAGN